MPYRGGEYMFRGLSGLGRGIGYAMDPQRKLEEEFRLLQLESLKRDLEREERDRKNVASSEKRLRKIMEDFEKGQEQQNYPSFTSPYGPPSQVPPATLQVPALGLGGMRFAEQPSPMPQGLRQPLRPTTITKRVSPEVTAQRLKKWLLEHPDITSTKRFELFSEMVKPEEKERRTFVDVNKRHRYEDTKELVFPGVKAKEEPTVAEKFWGKEGLKNEAERKRIISTFRLPKNTSWEDVLYVKNLLGESKDPSMAEINAKFNIGPLEIAVKYARESYNQKKIQKAYEQLIEAYRKRDAYLINNTNSEFEKLME